MLFSCAERDAVPDRAADETVMTEYSESLSVVVSQNGRRSYRFETPLLEGYTLGGEPYREFRRGVTVITYLDDSLSTVDATLRANYAIYYPDRQLWEARGDVAVEKHDGKRLYTQQLFWNARTRKIYSNVDSKFVHARGVSYGEGFEADEDFKDWRFRGQRSRFEVETPPRRRDSLAGAPDARSAEGSDASAAEPSIAPGAAPAPRRLPRREGRSGRSASDSSSGVGKRLSPEERLAPLSLPQRRTVGGEKAAPRAAERVERLEKAEKPERPDDPVPPRPAALR